MEREYELDGCKVVVQFVPKLIRIQGSEQLLAFLSADLNTHTLKLVKLIKADYLTIFGKPLKITHASLMVEIWGHLYASKFATALNELIKLNIIQNLTKTVIKRSNTIDCGEADVDSNRSFWDILAKFKSMIVKFL
ncbi:hypothetical protein WG904_06735 [Pedobacter sp. Du54]|uniref:hypothetical protein n=1 Tax=Pedobacter anseongensis TaxID=3133439 RepID=UPI0030B04CB8